MPEQTQPYTYIEESVVTIRCLSSIPADVEALLAEIAEEEESKQPE